MVDLGRLFAVLDTADWQQRFVAVARCEPGVSVGDAILGLLRNEGVAIPSWFEVEKLTPIDRALAERYLPILLRWELAYGTERLDAADARLAAELFLAPFGPATHFHATIMLTPDLVAAMEKRGPCSYGLTLGIFGSTLESALFAVDPDGLVGGIDIGDED
jgi:hypothetical protein